MCVPSRQREDAVLTDLPVIDFHTHVLHDMDDGSKSVGMSVEMLRKTRETGIGIVVSTSHYYRKKESISSFVSRRNEKLAELLPQLDASCSGIVPGAEIALYFGIEEDPDLDRLCIGDTRALLIEMPFQSWGPYEINALSSLCYDRRFTVILAHYERFADFQKDNELYEEVLKLPLYIQINALSLTFGLRSGKWLGMFRDGSAHLLGSDCHNLDSRPPDLDRGREAIRRKLGTDVLDRIDRNAVSLLLGKKPRRTSL